MSHTATHTDPLSAAAGRKPGRRSSRHIPRLILVPAIGALYLSSACGPEPQDDAPAQYDYVAVCSDPRTGNRVDDNQCRTAPQDFSGGADSSLHWFYMPTNSGYVAPPIGQRIPRTAGSYTTPKASKSGTPAIQRGGAPRSGGAVTRGGFGSSSKAGSGGS
ncbi:MAG TPA: hypothetical protein VGL46_12670 [Pseudonocardiaceae bacterium]|jgi:hypothetical protein